MIECPNVTAEWIAEHWDDALRLSNGALNTYKVPIQVQDREDAVHDAITSLISNDSLKNYLYTTPDGQKNVYPNDAWFGTMVARKVLTWLRKQGNDPISHRHTGGQTIRQRKIGCYLIPEQPSSHEPMTLDELLHDIHVCLDRKTPAPKRYHDIVDLKAQGWTISELATMCKVSCPRMNRILASIRGRLKTSPHVEAYPEIWEDAKDDLLEVDQ